MSDAYEILQLKPEVLSSGGSMLHQMSIRETYKLHSHTFFEFFCVAKGMALHDVNGKSQLLTEGDFVLIRPEDIHKYDFVNEYDMELINMSVTCSIFQDTCRYFDLDARQFLCPELPPLIHLHGYTLNDVKRKMLHLSGYPVGAERMAYLRSILPHLLFQFISTHSNEVSQPALPVWMTELLSDMSLKAHFTEGLPYLLQSANLSQEHLTREFRKYLNMTPTEFINMKRLNYAVRLLLESDMEIIDICHECGFNNVSHFYHNFKKQYGCSPKKFIEAEHAAC